MAELYKCGTRTCIVIGVGDANINAIPLDDKGLKLVSFTKQEFAEWSPVVGYSAQSAAQKYVKFAKLHGATDQALRLLKELANDKPKVEKEVKMARKPKKVEVEVEAHPSGIVIEKDVPLPSKRGGLGLASLLTQMEVGDSILTPAEKKASVQQAVTNLNQTTAMRFTARTVENGRRVWRTE